MVITTAVGPKYRTGDWQGAIEDANLALERDPSLAGAKTARARAKVNLQDIAGSRQDIEAILENDPSYLENLLQGAWAKVEEGDLDEAIEDYTDALIFRPDESSIWFNRGLAIYRKGNLTGTLADFDRAIQLSPIIPEYFSARASLRNLRQDIAGAISDLDSLLRLSPDATSAYEKRGKLKMLVHDIQGAVADFTAALAKNPDQALLYQLRGIAHFYDAQYPQSFDDFRRLLAFPAVEVNDTDRLYHYLARDFLGEGLIALAEYKAYLKIRPESEKNDWLTKLAGYFSGETTRETVLSAANQAVMDLTKQQQRSTALFFMAQNKLVNNHRTEAGELLEAVIETALEDSAEYHGAQIQLSRLRE